MIITIEKVYYKDSSAPSIPIDHTLLVFLCEAKVGNDSTHNPKKRDSLTESATSPSQNVYIDSWKENDERHSLAFLVDCL